MRILIFAVLSLLALAVPSLANPTLNVKSGAPGEGPIVVEVANMNAEIAYWVTLVPTNLPVGKWKQFHYFADQTAATVTFDGVPMGDYQVRLHDRAAGYALYATLDLDEKTPQVNTSATRAGTETITLLSEPYLREQISVSLSGLDPDPSVTYWITLIEADEPVGRWRVVHYITGQTDAEVTFKKQPRSRSLELRLHRKMEGEPLLSVLPISVSYRPSEGPARMDATVSALENGRFRIVASLENLNRNFTYSVQVANAALPVGYYVASSRAPVGGEKAQVRLDVLVPGNYELGLVAAGQDETLLEKSIQIGNPDNTSVTDPCALWTEGDPDSVAACLLAKSDERWSYQIRGSQVSCMAIQMDLARAKLAALNARSANTYPRGFEEVPPLPLPSCVEIADAARDGLGAIVSWTSCARSVGTNTTIGQRVDCMASLRDVDKFHSVDLFPTRCTGVEKLLMAAYGDVLVLDGGSKETLSLAGLPVQCDDYRSFMENNEKTLEDAAQKELLAAQAEAEKAEEKNWLAREIRNERAFWQTQRTGGALVDLRNAVHPADQIDESYVSDALVTALHILEPRGSGSVHSANGLVLSLANQMVFYHGVRQVKLQNCERPPDQANTATCRTTITMANFMDFPNEQTGGVLGAFLTGLGGQGPRSETFDLKLRHDGQRWQIADLSGDLVDFLLVPPSTEIQHTRPSYSPEECVWMQSVGFNPC